MPRGSPASGQALVLHSGRPLRVMSARSRQAPLMMTPPSLRCTAVRLARPPHRPIKPKTANKMRRRDGEVEVNFMCGSDRVRRSRQQRAKAPTACVSMQPRRAYKSSRKQIQEPAAHTSTPAVEHDRRKRSTPEIKRTAGWRSALATKTLQDMGMTNVAHIDGGYTAWKKAHAPMVTLEQHKAESASRKSH